MVKNDLKTNKLPFKDVMVGIISFDDEVLMDVLTASANTNGTYGTDGLQEWNEIGA